MSRSRQFCLNLPTEAKVWLLKVGEKCWKVVRGRRQHWGHDLYFIWQFENYSWSSVGERAQPRFLLFRSSPPISHSHSFLKTFLLVLPIKCFSHLKQSVVVFGLNGFLLHNLCSFFFLLPLLHFPSFPHSILLHQAAATQPQFQRHGLLLARLVELMIHWEGAG